MTVDLLTRTLFGLFPRDVSNPTRRSIWSIHELNRFIEENDKINDCFISVYNDSTFDQQGRKRSETPEGIIPEDKLVIDKVFFDFDNRIGHNPVQPMSTVLSESQAVARWLIAKGIQIVPLASGKKGVHLLALMSPKTYSEPKKALRNFAMYVLESVSDQPFLTCDTHVLGDVRRISRIPNTSRPPENTSYCTYIPVDLFLKMTTVDLYNWSKTRTYIDNFQIRQKTYENTLDEYLTFEPKRKRYYISNGFTDESLNTNSAGLTTVTIQTTAHQRLEAILRKCIYSSLTDKDPRHHIRVAATIDLLRANLSVDTIVNLYSQLGWVDFREAKTREQIEQIRSQGYESYHCSRIRELGCKNGGHCCF